MTGNQQRGRRFRRWRAPRATAAVLAPMAAAALVFAFAAGGDGQDLATTATAAEGVSHVRAFGIEPGDGDPDAGAEVFRSSCAMCHGSDATGMMGMHPALTGAVERLGRDGVEVTIRNGRATNPPMPSFGNRLSDDEIADVVAYIGALPDGPRNFGPGHQDGMGGGMMDRMMGGGPGWMVVLVVILSAALAGVIGYLIGTSRSRRSGG